jgi:copper chaperone CopZ
MVTTVHLKVAMMCSGCSGAVERVLGKMEGGCRPRDAAPSDESMIETRCMRHILVLIFREQHKNFSKENWAPSPSPSPSPSPAPGSLPGVNSFDVNLETQKVTVVGDVTQEEVIEKIAKTGKAVEVWAD